MPDPIPYTIYTLPDGLHVRTMGAARMVEGEGADRRVKVYPVDGVPSIEAAAWVPCSDMIEVASDTEWAAQH